jgi:serine protease inhibitor
LVRTGPFLFVVHDVETATPLFVGRVDDPTSTSD